ncbi:hypothetical protein Efla_002755 [Eimeria flavescens]
MKFLLLPRQLQQQQQQLLLLLLLLLLRRPPSSEAAATGLAEAAATHLRAATAAAAAANECKAGVVRTPHLRCRGRLLLAWNTRSSSSSSGFGSSRISSSRSSSSSSSSRLHVWGVPLIDDGVGRVRRPSVDFAFEHGQREANIAYDYLTANLLAQRVLLNQREGSLVLVEAEGLGRAADKRLSAEEAAGGTRVDPNELKKIENVLPSFTRPDGSGVLRLLSACDGQFAFVYQGPLEHRLGVKEWVRYMITSVYPGAEVKFLTEHYADPDDRPGFLKGFIPDEEVSEYRKALRWRYPRLYRHDGDRPIPGGHRPSPQPIP